MSRLWEVHAGRRLRCRESAWLSLVLCLCALASASAATAPAPAEPSAQAIRLTLADCVRLAVARNADVGAAREEAAAAKAQRKEAFAAYLPSVNATAQYTRLDEPRTVRYKTPAAVRDFSLDTAAWWSIARVAGTAAADAAFDNRAVDPMQTFNNARTQAASAFPTSQAQPIIGKQFWEADVILKQPLFTGGKISQANAMAELNQKIHELAIGATEDDIVMNVTVAYRGALTAQQVQHDLSELQVQLSTLRESVQGMLAEGSEKASTRDLTRLEVALAHTEQGLAESRRAGQSAMAALRLLIGQDDATPLHLAPVEQAEASPVMALQDCERFALNRRPEMNQAHMASKLAGHGISRAKASFSPDVAAFAGWRYLDDQGDIVDPGDNTEWFAGVRLSVPIFEGFSRFAKVAEARSHKRKAMQVELQAQRGILLEVRDAYYALQAAQSKAAAAARMVEQAGKLRKVTEAARVQHIGSDYRRMLLLQDEPALMEFKVVPDVEDQVEADMADTEARINRAQAELGLAVARARLARAMGVRSLDEVKP